jgi:hypothetical protein
MPRKPSGAIVPTFSKQELLPSTGSSVEEFSSESASRVVAKISALDGIYLQHPAHKRLFAQFDYLRELGQATNGPKRAMRLIGPSSAGKSTAIDQYIRLDARRREPNEGHIPVLSVKLDKACTTKRYVSSILDRYGDEYSESSVESTLRKRLYLCVAKFRTELIFVDEVQHLAFRASERSDPSDALKRMLDDCVVPLVFAGDETALPLMKGNIQLANRMIAPGDIMPLDLQSSEDKETFRSFVKRLDIEMAERSITAQTSNLADLRMLQCLFVVSGGLLGRVVNLIRAALEIAARRRADFIEPHDFSAAVRAWAIPQAIIKYDPFSRGIIVE